MLMSVKAPWPPFPFFPYSDLPKIRALQRAQAPFALKLEALTTESLALCRKYGLNISSKAWIQRFTKDLFSSFVLCKASSQEKDSSVKSAFSLGKSGKSWIPLT